MTSPSLGLLRRRRHETSVTMGGLDGSHLGVALGLARASLARDTAARDLIARSVDPHRALGSCLELLLAQVHAVAERETGQPGHTPCDGGAAFLFRFAETAPDPQTSLLCRQIGMGLLRDPYTEKVSLTPVPVYALVDLCVYIARFVEDRHGLSAGAQFDAFEEALLARSLGA